MKGANRIAADELRQAILKSGSLENAHEFLNQTARTALSNGTATLEERLARWLLMANDRLRGDEIPLLASRHSGERVLVG